MNYLQSSYPVRDGWYWYLLVITASLLAMFTIGNLPFAAVFFADKMKEGVDFSIANIDKNLMLAVALFPHVAFLAAAIFLVKIVHGRSWQNVVNGANRVRWSRFFFGFMIWGILSAAGLVVTYCVAPESISLNFQPVKFLIMIAIAIVMIPAQAVSEEYFFRGYLAQGIASHTKNRWCVLLIPALLFGLAHSANPEVKEYGFALMMSQYVLMGLMFGLMSILDDGIELAMGVHTVNNLFIVLFATNENSVLQTDAIFKVSEINMARDTFILLVAGVAMLAITAVKYKWSFRVMFRKI